MDASADPARPVQSRPTRATPNWIKSGDWDALTSSDRAIRRDPLVISRPESVNRRKLASVVEVQCITASELASLGALIHSLNGLIKRYCDALPTEEPIEVLLVSRLRFDGDACIAFNAGSTIFLAAPLGRDRDVGLTGLADALIHEVSEVLLRRHAADFYTDGWTSALPHGFQYYGPENDDDALASHEPSEEERMTTGFVTNYSMRSLSDDFAEFSVELFTRHLRLRRWAQDSERIALKLAVARRFYSRLSPEFTDAFFDRMSAPP